VIYIIGSLRNPRIPEVGRELRRLGHEVFDDWFAAGPLADDAWKEYEQSLGRNYAEALDGAAADHVFSFDKRHLDAAEGAVLVAPAGKSAHLELGYMVGQGKRTAVLIDSPDRWDVMYKFADAVVFTISELADVLSEWEG
jgi:hypothetical protein